MRFKPTPLTHAISALALLSMALAAGQAQAQQAAADLQRVTVTGSNVKRAGDDSTTQIQTITRQDIERSTAPTIGELLLNISANTGGSSSETAINNQSGAAGISLRGLGQKSTLILINGRRMANHAIAQNGQDTFVDLNSIPKSAVERIEILKDGASAIYGSDAIAGVVNIILRKSMKGLEINASVGRATQGGLGENQVSLAGGLSAMDDRFKLTGVLDIFHRDMLLLSDRPWLNGLDFRNQPGGTYFPAASGGTWQRAVFNPATGSLSLRRQALPNCLGGSTPQDALLGAGVYSGTSCTYNVDKYLTAYPQADRLGGLLRGTFQVNADMELFAELGLSDNKSNWINQPQTMTNLSVVFNPTTGGFRSFSNIIGNVPANAAVLATNTLGGNGTSARLNYTFFDVGARTFDLRTNTQRALLGLSGTAAGWEYEAALTSSQSKVSTTTGNQVDAQLLRTLVDQGGYNFLAPTQAQTDALRVSTKREATSILNALDFKVSKSLMQMEAGPLGFAAGLETRSESMVDTPDPLAQQGRLIGTGSSRTDGSRTASALFAEFNVPAAKGLEFQLAGRFDSYSDFGTAFSPKIGAKYQVLPSMLLRASVAKGFRAPTLVENSQSASLGFDSVIDPVLNNASSVVGVLNRGASNLKAEQSTSTGLGFVIEPTKGVSVAVDYYKVEQNDLVALNGAQFIVNNAARFPGSIVRDPVTNNILVIYDSYSNLANISTTGLDIDVAAKFPATSIGKFGVRATATYLFGWLYQGKAGDPTVDYAGRNDGPFGSLPRLKTRIALDWEKESIRATVAMNTTASYEQRNVTTPAGLTVDGQTTFDLLLGYSPMKSLNLNLGITNLFDLNPPFDAGSGIGFSSSQYNVRGRYVRAGLEYKF